MARKRITYKSRTHKIGGVHVLCVYRDSLFTETESLQRYTVYRAAPPWDGLLEALTLQLDVVMIGGDHHKPRLPLPVIRPSSQGEHLLPRWASFHPCPIFAFLWFLPEGRQFYSGYPPFGHHFILHIFVKGLFMILGVMQWEKIGIQNLIGTHYFQIYTFKHKKWFL